MDLTEYIKSRNIRIIDAAKELKVSRQTLSPILNGKTPSLKMACRIERWSNGQVTAINLLSLKSEAPTTR